MPRAAVPHYLGTDFQEASPGLRFTYYLPIWTERADQEREVKHLARRRSEEAKELHHILRENGMDAAIAHMHRRKSFPKLWEKNDFAASRTVWKNLSGLNKEDRRRIEALRERQDALAQSMGEGIFTAFATSTAPFTTGLGNEHPLENGFAFLWPHGLPYLPGSGVKGVLRRAAQELAQGLWGENGGWDDEPRHEITVNKKTLHLSDIELLFGKEPPPGDSNHFRGCLEFWDVYPQMDRLLVEIMTPHQKHYYQDGEPPHDCGQPNPIKFLTVPPGAAFTFHVVCDLHRLTRLARQLSEDGRWRKLLATAFEHAFQWLGFGAKTAVGYGVMVRDEQAERAAEERRRQAEEAARRQAMSPEEQQIDDLRRRYENEKAKGNLTANGQVSEQRLRLLEAALKWQDPKLRCQAGKLLQEIAKDLPWPKKRRKEANEQVQQLLEDCP